MRNNETLTPTALDIARIRSHFPALDGGAAHFDGPGGSQTPDVVANAIRDTLLRPLANRGVTTVAERNAEEAVINCRSAVADLLNTSADSVIFGRSMTALTFDVARMLSARWSPGDEIVLSRLDHDANVRPWVIAAQRTGVTVRWLDFDTHTSELPVATLEQQLTDRTRLVAVTAASNLIGTMPDIAAFAAAAHAAGAMLYVDGVHYAAHTLVDTQLLDADFFACSPYKYLGPHCGIVTGKPEILAELQPDKLLPSTNRVPERFELGTLPYELMAGTTAAIDFLAGLAETAGSRRERLEASMRLVEQHEEALREKIEAGISELPGATLYSRARRRTPTLLATFDGVESAAVSQFLAGEGVNAPAGSFYAYEAARHLGLGDAGGVRVGLAPYNNADDVERLMVALNKFFSKPSAAKAGITR
jgi:cysteine desulfurase family protein (TIGR01976 family)